ncbi:hypothetical protein EIN_095720 [Entamoeba invadens IP1]|uniref:RGS domain-containing protein n=1 Tax=Entamoeba invadens IP1 TaxID=370355 RepID=A0A0A1U099_ENTIV|nr:hypothetical protein EIN_095720 [Entamoeba invadens IP1]ELP87315.1 hypothetical protein EIN_095720 [Entamoeba invadens IP1]|eukprot:XP_004254086.1 hypothetical protein EIN_095720 [Entamoeba invadens IP1]
MMRRNYFFKQVSLDEKSVSDKQMCENFRKSTSQLLTDMKGVIQIFQSLKATVVSINNQLRSIYTFGNSIIANDVRNFLDSCNLEASACPLLEKEVDFCENFYKEFGKKISRMTNEEARLFAEQRFDFLDSSVLLYMKTMIGLNGENSKNLNRIIFNAVQDGLMIPKTLKILSSLETTVSSRVGSLYLSKFLRESCEEKLVQFYRAVQLYHSIEADHIRSWVCKTIFETFICVNSEEEISLPSAIRNKINLEYSKGFGADIFDEAKQYVLDTMIKENVFERFQKSRYFKTLVERLTPVFKTDKSSSDECEDGVSFTVDTYVNVAQYLIPYNLVDYTENFVSIGYTSPKLMEMIGEKEFEKFANNEVDKKRLMTFVKLAKEGKLEKSPIVTKEAIIKIVTIQNNFVLYLEKIHPEGTSETLQFLAYVKETPVDQMTTSQILEKSENAFIELNSKHHVAYRMLKKCDSVKEMVPLIVQCRTALIALLADLHVEEYNESTFWVEGKKCDVNLHRTSTPELINGEVTPKNKTRTAEDSGKCVEEDYEDDAKSRESMKLMMLCRRATENNLKNSLQKDAENRIFGSDKQESSVNNAMSLIKTNIVPKLGKMKQKCFEINEKDEVERLNTELDSFASFFALFGEDMSVTQQKQFVLKITNKEVRKKVVETLNKIETMQSVADVVLDNLITLLTQVRQTNASVLKYQKIVQQLAII